MRGVVTIAVLPPVVCYAHILPHQARVPATTRVDSSLSAAPQAIISMISAASLDGIMQVQTNTLNITLPVTLPLHP